MRKRARVITKSEIVKSVAAKLGITKKDALDVINTFLDELRDLIVSKKTIELRGFGTFGVKLRRGREARNPKTGEKVKVGDRYVAFFKPGKSIKHTLKNQE